MRTVLVVGGASAVAAATVETLSAAEWRCLHSTSRSDAVGFDLVVDLTQPESISAARRLLPDLDGLIILAGMTPQRALGDVDSAYVARMLELHVGGPLLLVQALTSKLLDGAGIVFASSVAAYRGSFDPAYSAAKGGVAALTRTLARSMAPKVRVNAVAPGLVRGTSVYDGMTDDFRQHHMDSTLLNRLSTPMDCAKAIQFLLVQRNMTGAILHLNSGQYLA